MRARNRTLVLGVTDPSVVDMKVQEQPLSGVFSWFSKSVQLESSKQTDKVLDEIKTTEARTGASGGGAYATEVSDIDRAAKLMRLPSGILLATLERRSVNDRVTVFLQFRWGAPQGMAALPAWRALGPSLLSVDVNGLTPLNAEQIAFLTAKIQARLSYLPSPQGFTVALDVPRERLQIALQLLRDQMRAPVLPGWAFDFLQTHELARLAESKHDPQWASELARQHRMAALGLQQGQPGYVDSAAELIEIWKHLDIEAVRDYWKRYWSANDLRIGAVGPLPENFLGMIELYFGDWKKPQAPAFERWVPSFKPEEGARFVSAREPGKADLDKSHASAQVHWSQGFALNADDEDAAAMTVGARILAGGDIGGSRLTDRLRGHDAMSYSVDYSLDLPQQGNAAMLSLNASASPANALRVEAAMREELARLRERGITQAELDAARHELREERRRALSSDIALAATLLAQLEQTDDFAQDEARHLAALDALTVERVDAALRRLLMPDRWVIVITEADSTDQ